MEQNLSDYARRKDALHDQLADILEPETEHERSMLAWLRDSVSLDGLAAFAEMAERALQPHVVNDQLGKLVSESYDKGFAEGVEHGKAGGQP